MSNYDATGTEETRHQETNVWSDPESLTREEERGKCGEWGTSEHSEHLGECFISQSGGYNLSVPSLSTKVRMQHTQ